jgi:flagellar protein FliO/FliZ
VSACAVCIDNRNRIVNAQPLPCTATRGFALCAGAVLLTLAPVAHAQAAPSTGGPSLTPLLMGLLLVLALIGAAAWLLRRAGLAQPGSTAGLRVVAQMALGPRERLVIIEIADRRWLLGVSAAGITRLGTLPPGSEGSVPPTAGGERSFADLIRRFAAPR